MKSSLVDQNALDPIVVNVEAAAVVDRQRDCFAECAGGLFGQRECRQERASRTEYEHRRLTTIQNEQVSKTVECQVDDPFELICCGLLLDGTNGFAVAVEQGDAGIPVEGSDLVQCVDCEALRTQRSERPRTERRRGRT